MTPSFGGGFARRSAGTGTGSAGRTPASRRGAVSMTTSRNGSVVARRLSRHARVSASPLKTHITRLTRGAARTASLRDSERGFAPLPKPPPGSVAPAKPADRSHRKGRDAPPMPPHGSRLRRQSRRIDHIGRARRPSDASHGSRLRRQSRRSTGGYSDALLVRLQPVPTIPQQVSAGAGPRNEPDEARGRRRPEAYAVVRRGPAPTENEVWRS